MQGSGCKDTQISKTYSIAENITGNYDNSYSPGIVEDNVGNTTTCPNVKVRVTGTTIKDYTEGAVFMYDGKTGLNNTTWQDQSGNGRNGTLVGAVKSGNSVYFDGVDDYVRIAELNYSQITLESSFMPVDSKYGNIISNVESGGYRLAKNGDNRMYLSVNYKGEYWGSVSGDAIINSKNYLGGTANSSKINSFINGNFYSTSAGGNIVQTNKNTYIVLGINPKGSTYDPAYIEAFHGYIYTARMYSKVLTEDNLQKHYVIDKWRFNF